MDLLAHHADLAYGRIPSVIEATTSPRPTITRSASTPRETPPSPCARGRTRASNGGPVHGRKSLAIATALRVCFLHDDLVVVHAQHADRGAILDESPLGHDVHPLAVQLNLNVLSWIDWLLMYVQITTILEEP